MAQNKKSFVAYCDWLDSFEELSDEEAGKLVKHLFRYVNDKNPDAPDKLTKLCFIPIQQSLKRDLKKYEAYVKKQSENGAKGGRPPKPTEPKKPNALFENPNEPKKADSVSVSANGSVSDNADSKNYLKQPDLFQVFWNLYGKKEEEVKCQREWAKIDSHEYAKIIEHVPKFVQASGNFLCKPFNYLDGRRWNDEQLPNYNNKPNLKQPPDKDAPVIWTEKDIKDYIENPFISNEAKEAFMQERMRESTNKINIDILTPKKLNA